jgi:hypothetical protein
MCPTQRQRSCPEDHWQGANCVQGKHGGSACTSASAALRDRSETRVRCGAWKSTADRGRLPNPPPSPAAVPDLLRCMGAQRFSAVCRRALCRVGPAASTSPRSAHRALRTSQGSAVCQCSPSLALFRGSRAALTQVCPVQQGEQGCWQVPMVTAVLGTARNQGAWPHAPPGLHPTRVHASPTRCAQLGCSASCAASMLILLSPAHQGAGKPA